MGSKIYPESLLRFGLHLPDFKGEFSNRIQLESIQPERIESEGCFGARFSSELGPPAQSIATQELNRSSRRALFQSASLGQNGTGVRECSASSDSIACHLARPVPVNLRSGSVARPISQNSLERRMLSIHASI